MADSRSHESHLDGSGCETQSNQRQFGYIIDKSASAANKKNVSVYGGSGSKTLSSIVVTSSNLAELVIIPEVAPNKTLTFLLRVEGWYS